MAVYFGHRSTIWRCGVKKRSEERPECCGLGQTRLSCPSRSGHCSSGCQLGDVIRCVRRTNTAIEFGSTVGILEPTTEGAACRYFRLAQRAATVV